MQGSTHTHTHTQGRQPAASHFTSRLIFLALRLYLLEHGCAGSSQILGRYAVAIVFFFAVLCAAISTSLCVGCCRVSPHSPAQPRHEDLRGLHRRLPPAPGQERAVDHTVL